MPQNPKSGQAISNPKRQNLTIAISPEPVNPIKTKFETKLKPPITLRGW